MRNDSIIKTAVHRTQHPEWTKLIHICLVYLQKIIEKRKIHPKKTSEAQHTHNEEDTRNTQRDSEKLKPKQNCTSHSIFTYAHIVKIAFVIFIVPYRYPNTC